MQLSGTTYAAYLFDLDGTLYNRDTLVKNLLEEQYREFCAELPSMPAQTFVDRVTELDAHGYNPKEQLYAQLAAEWDLAPALQSRLLNHFWDRYDTYCHLPEDTLTTLQTLREHGVKLGIITNGQTRRQNKKIDKLGIRGYFDTVVISQAEGIKKPDAEIFNRALTRCGTSARESVFIGDHPTADIDGARNAGLHAIWRQVPYWQMTRNDVRSVNHLREILG